MAVPVPGAQDIRYAPSGDVSIAYQVVGDGPVDVVFVSGFISHLELNWELEFYAGMLRRLVRYARVVCIDKRGTGLSDRTLGYGSAAERADDIRAVMDAVGLERAAIHAVSEGGPLALLFAATDPERVTRLALYGTFARLLPDDGYDPPAPWDVDRLVMGIERSWGTGDVFTRFLAAAPRPDVAREAVARFERNACTPKVAGQIMRANFTIDVRDVLPSVSAPVLVAHRRGDPIVPAWHGRYLAAQLPHARHVELEGDFHVPWAASDGDDFHAELHAFLVAGADAPAPAEERVLATVLFTDLVDSTGRAAQSGDARWRDLLDAHDAAARREVARSGGTLVKSTGDGILATFESPVRAVGCARSLRDELGLLGLAMRAGLHTGEVERRDEDISGMAVHLAARVLAVAAPGEVLVSRTVRDLVSGSGLSLEDRGEHALKGFDEPWRLYALADGSGA